MAGLNRRAFIAMTAAAPLEAALPAISAPAVKPSLIIAVDPARWGCDETVFRVTADQMLIAWERMPPGRGWSPSLDTIEKVCRALPDAKVRVKWSGAGHAFAALLESRGIPATCEPVEPA